MIFETDTPGLSDASLRTALRDFVDQPAASKEPFLQANFRHGFDGYSFWGQTDSKNQYDTDMLHSFVVSEFTPADRFPTGFTRFFETEWSGLKQAVEQTERQILRSLDVPGLEQLYDTSIGHMISCNYYPETRTARQTARGNTRLSQHKDVSLLTTFAFGVDAGLSYRDGHGQRVELGQKAQIISFPGYLMEVLTEGNIKALDHQVDLPTDTTAERFSFAFFSIPRPGSQLRLGNVDLSAEAYHQQYLSLF